VRLWDVGGDLGRAATRDERLVSPPRRDKGVGESVGREVVGAVSLQGDATFRLRFSPVAGLGQRLDETGADGGAIRGRLDRLAVGGDGVLGLAEAGQNIAEPLIRAGVVRS
jgi:hypothetical protein